MNQAEAWAIFCRESDEAAYEYGSNLNEVNARYAIKRDKVANRYQDTMQAIKIEAMGRDLFGPMVDE